MKALEISNLDQHLKPVQVDGVSTGLELSTTDLRISGGDLSINNLTAGTAKVDGDLTVDGDLDMTGSATSINMSNGVSINTNQNVGDLTIYTKNISFLANAYDGDGSFEDNDATLLIAASTGYDPAIRLFNFTTLTWNIGSDSDDSNKFKLDWNNTTGAATKLTLDNNGDLTTAGDITSGDDIAVASSGKISFDGIGGDTYIFEHSSDHLRLVVGGDDILRFTEGGSNGNTVHFKDSSAGFTQLEPTYNASDTAVDFRASNKQFLTFGAGNIADLNLQFPAMSGNFTLIIKQDASGSRTINSDGWLVFDSLGNAAAGSTTVKFPSGTNPTLSTEPNHVDIVSFYWDADNEIAYGVATLDFQF